MPGIIPIPKDNASAQLSAGINASSSAFVLKAGEGANFPQPLTDLATSLGDNVTLNSTGIQALGVAVGDFIYNLTDSTPASDIWSVAVIVSITADAVVTTPLRGGTANIWGNSDEWCIKPFVMNLSIRTGGVLTGAVTQYEKVLITDRSTDTLSIPTTSGYRGFDGTSPNTFSLDDFVTVQIDQSIPDGLRKILAQVIRDLNVSQFLRTDGTLPMAADLAMGANAITGVEDPTNDQDAATKKWTVDNFLGSKVPDSVFGIYDDINYIETAPGAPTIVEGAAGSVSATSVIVRLGYASTTGYTEASPESNTLASVISKKITIPVVASADAGVTGIVIELNIDGAGFELWDTVANTTGNQTYDAEALTAAVLSASNTSKKSIIFDADAITADRTITMPDADVDLGDVETMKYVGPYTTTDYNDSHDGNETDWTSFRTITGSVNKINVYKGLTQLWQTSGYQDRRTEIRSTLNGGTPVVYTGGTSSFSACNIAVFDGDVLELEFRQVGFLTGTPSSSTSNNNLATIFEE